MKLQLLSGWMDQPKQLVIWLFRGSQAVFLALFLGLCVGLLFPGFGLSCEFLGLGFLSLIRMMTIPLVFFTLLYGITSLDSGQAVGRLLARGVTVFLMTALVAVILAMLVAHGLEPGINGAHFSALPSALPSAEGEIHAGWGVPQWVRFLIPTSPLASMAEGNIFHTIVFAAVLGVAIRLRRAPAVTVLCHEMAFLCFDIMRGILRLAPLGIFGSIAWMVAKEGAGSLLGLFSLVMTVVLACALQYAVFALMVAWSVRRSPWPFFSKLSEIQWTAFATSSSKVVLPRLMELLERDLGVGVSYSRFILPLSSVLNMVGGAIYQAVCAIFFAQYYGLTLMWTDYAMLAMMCTVASIGGAGVPGGVLLFLGMVLQSIGLPTEAVLVVATVDRLLDMVTTMVNVTGDACVTLWVAGRDGGVDRDRYMAPKMGE
jgi:Na+/H+-dicarboxylate symporter